MESEESELIPVKESDILLSQYREYIVDIENSLDGNTNKAIELSKALLDSICKTVLRDLGKDFDKGWNTPKLVKETLNNLPFLNTLKTKDIDASKKIIGAIITLSHGICEFRNNYSFATHGLDIHEEYSERLYAQLVFDAVKTVGNFILEIHTNLTPISYKSRIHYEDYMDFNSWFDEVNGDVIIGELRFSASQILFNNDIEAYKEALNEFMQIKEEL